MIFFFNDTATTEIYTLSLHDALPICATPPSSPCWAPRSAAGCPCSACAAACSCSTSHWAARSRDRKSTRLNSSHANISYAVFCLKKKNNIYYLLLLIVLSYFCAHFRI